jgi:hypothetical protein
MSQPPSLTPTFRSGSLPIIVDDLVEADQGSMPKFDLKISAQTTSIVSLTVCTVSAGRDESNVQTLSFNDKDEQTIEVISSESHPYTPILDS